MKEIQRNPGSPPDDERMMDRDPLDAMIRSMAKSLDAASEAGIPGPDLDPEDGGAGGEGLDSVLARIERFRALKAVTETLRQSAFEARSFATQRLRELLAECCDRLWASAAWLFHKTEEHLRAVHTIRTDRRDLVLGLEEVSVSTWVAKSKKAYWTNDAQNDPKFRRSLGDKSKSAMSAPLVDHAEELGGVVCLESSHKGAFGAVPLAQLIGMAAEMTPHLLVLEAVNRGDDLWCPWHPRVHRWDLSRVLRVVCHAIREAVDGAGSDAIACAIWAVDRPNRALYVYADALHGSEFVRDQWLGFKSFTGCVADCPKGTTGRVRPRHDTNSLLTIPTASGDVTRRGTRFLLEHKGDYMGLEEVVAAPVHLGGGEPYEADYVLAIYAYSERAAAALPSREEVTRIAQVLGEVMSAYDAQRARLAATYLAKVVDAFRPEDYIPILRDMKELFRLKKARFYTCPRGEYVVFGDAPGPRPLERRDGAVAYLDYLRDNPGMAIRTNDAHSWRPPDLPAEDTHAWTPWRDAKRRRFLDIGVAGGVLRLIRPEQSKPFCPSDERLLLDLAASWSRSTRRPMSRAYEDASE